jgi:hypothetical protein
MSEKQQQFRAFLANLKNNLKQTQSGVFIAEKLNALLHNKGVVLVTQRNVRDIDLAVKELQKANDAIASALAALHYFPDLDNTRLAEAQATTAEYKAVLVDVVDKAYQRRRDVAQGVTA